MSEPRETFDVETLMEIFHFTQEDLNHNRDHKLSEYQRQKLVGWGGRRLLLWVGGFMVFCFVSSYPLNVKSEGNEGVIPGILIGLMLVLGLGSVSQIIVLTGQVLAFGASSHKRDVKVSRWPLAALLGDELVDKKKMFSDSTLNFLEPLDLSHLRYYVSENMGRFRVYHIKMLGRHFLLSVEPDAD